MSITYGGQHGRMARGGHGLPRVSPGPPCPTPCGRPPLKCFASKKRKIFRLGWNLVETSGWYPRLACMFWFQDFIVLYIENKQNNYFLTWSAWPWHSFHVCSRDGQPQGGLRLSPTGTGFCQTATTIRTVGGHPWTSLTTGPGMATCRASLLSNKRLLLSAVWLFVFYMIFSRCDREVTADYSFTCLLRFMSVVSL
jgi:hypothetical protein